MRLYPVFLNLCGRRVLVVGGGRVASRKARSFLSASARVTVVAPRLSSSFPAGIRHLRRRYRRADLAGKSLAVAATDNPTLNATVARDASTAGVLVNVVDDPGRCDYHVPALFRRGHLAIAISTGGSSPALARRIRRELAQAYGPAYGSYLSLMERLRARILKLPDVRHRRFLLRRIADPSLVSFYKQRGRSAVHRAILAHLGKR